MPDIFDRVVRLNLIANTPIFYVAARLYLLPLRSIAPSSERDYLATIKGFRPRAPLFD
jgi:hypothetical protein